MAWNNLGLALQSVNDVDGAIGAFRRAIALQPDFEHAHWNLALALLLDGQYAEGWREYESRFALSELGKDRHAFAGPAWDGAAPQREDPAALHRAGPGRCLAVRALRRAAGKSRRALHRLLSAGAGAFARHGSGRRADGERPGSAAALRRASAAAVAAPAARHDDRRDTGGCSLRHRRAGAPRRGAQVARSVAATAQRRHRLDRQSGQSEQSYPLGAAGRARSAVRGRRHRLVFAATRAHDRRIHRGRAQSSLAAAARRLGAGRHRRIDRRARSGDQRVHQHRAPVGRARPTDLDDARLRRRLALAAGSRRQSVVPDDAPVPPAASARLERRRASRSRSSCARSSRR